MDRLFGYNLSTRALQQNVAEDAESVEAYYAQKSPPCPESEAEILVIQADGKGIPMVLEEDEVAEAQVRLGKGQKHGHKKEAIVTTVYTIKAAPRTPTEVIASFFKEISLRRAQKRFQATKQAYLGDIGRKDVALSRLTKQVALREGAHIHYRIALCDGCEALQSRIVLQFQALFSSWTLCTRTNIYGMPRIVCWAKPVSNAGVGQKPHAPNPIWTNRTSHCRTAPDC